MKLIKNSIIILIGFISTLATANNLQITNIQDLGSNQVSFDIAWENAWRIGTDYHDAVWVFVKYKSNNSSQWLHADVTSTTAGGNLEEVTQTDQKGVFIRLNTDYRGNISATTVTLQLGNIQGVLPDFKVFGIEMVYVPQGAFYVGDGAGGAPTRYAMEGDTSMPFHVTSENALTTPNGVEYVNTLTSFPRNSTAISAGFPKGYDAFYCMKYEITQKQYVDFLNTLTRPQQNTNTYTDVSGTNITNRYVMNNFTTPIAGNGIKCDAVLPSGPITFYCDINNNDTPNEATDGLSNACNIQFIVGILSYLDWSALRPMSSFEFEKAARGPLQPVTREYVWGTTQITPIPLNSMVNNNTAIETTTVTGEGIVLLNNATSRVGYAATATTTRSQASASYYGIMNLGDNASELMIAPETYTVNGVLGTTYIGSLGDGMLTITGERTNTDWEETDLGSYTYHRNTQAVAGYTSRLQYRISPNGYLTELGGRGVR